jgi:hypothetical protein
LLDSVLKVLKYKSIKTQFIIFGLNRHNYFQMTLRTMLTPEDWMEEDPRDRRPMSRQRIFFRWPRDPLARRPLLSRRSSGYEFFFGLS